MRGLMLHLILSLLALVAVRAPTAPAIACPVGQTTMLRGSGPARSGILLQWDTQIIGGGVVRADGTWQLPLAPAADAPSGDYPVAVTERDSGQILGVWTCQVINRTLPTPGQRMPDRATPPPTATAHRTSTPAFVVDPFIGSGSAAHGDRTSHQHRHGDSHAAADRDRTANRDRHGDDNGDGDTNRYADRRCCPADNDGLHARVHRCR